MAASETDKGKLPGNHGQFGENDATEDYKPLEKPPAAEQAKSPDQPPGAQAEVQGQTNAGERS